MTTEILVPISLGELYDKVSILELKKEFIKDPVKLENITNELAELLKIFVQFPIDHDLYKRLKDVNLRLWHIEDKIRENERIKLFDDTFINLAKSVYYKNDERAEIKKEINLKYNSAIIEEKLYEKY